MNELDPNKPQESAFHGQSIPLVQAKPAHQALFPYFLVALGTLLVVVPWLSRCNSTACSIT